jgi:molecular chaperone HtpG
MLEIKHSTRISKLQKKGYEVLLNSPIISPIQKNEGDNNLTFVRVDSDHIDNLIKKENNDF